MSAIAEDAKPEDAKPESEKKIYYCEVSAFLNGFLEYMPECRLKVLKTTEVRQNWLSCSVAGWWERLLMLEDNLAGSWKNCLSGFVNLVCSWAVTGIL